MLEAAAHRVHLLLLDDHRDGLAAVDLEIEERGALADDRPHLAFLHLERARIRAARVDDSGHQALAAQAARGARAELGARSDFQGGAGSGHRTGENRETRRKTEPVATFGRGRGLEDSQRQAATVGKAGLDRRRAGRPLRGNQGHQRRPLRGGRQRAAGAAPPGDGDEDGRRARRDEGRGDEARPVRLLHRHRVHPRGVPRDLPGAAGETAHRRPGDALGARSRRCWRTSTTANRCRSCSPSSRPRPSPRPRSARCTGPSCSTAARSRSRSSTRGSPRRSKPTSATPARSCGWPGRSRPASTPRRSPRSCANG